MIMPVGPLVVPVRRAAAGLILAIATLGPPPAQAAEAARGLLSFGAGALDVLRDDPTVEGRMEYRFPLSIAAFHPFAGALATSEGSGFVYGGLQLQWDWGRHLAAVFSVAPGAYIEGGGRDLGSAFQVRSGIELAWRFGDGSRIGLQFAHTSNLDTGDRNPGAESLSLCYSLPLERLKRWL